MKINLTTTTPEPLKMEEGLTESALHKSALHKSAPSGVYICCTHHGRFPNERFIKNGRLVTRLDLLPSGALDLVQIKDKSDSGDCRFVLAPEQVVNITFEKAPTVGSLVESIIDGAKAAGSSPATPAAPTSIEVGDYVRVTRASSHGERGWANIWVTQMSPTVGKVFRVINTQPNYSGGPQIVQLATGEFLNSAALNFWYPFFVLEKLSPEELLERYKRAHRASDLRVGDTVRVTRKADSFEGGWKSSWQSDMDKMIGETFEIIRDYGSSGFTLAKTSEGNEGLFGGWSFPFSVLEKVS